MAGEMVSFEADGGILGATMVLGQESEVVEATGRSAILVDEKVLITEAGVFACTIGGCNNKATCVAKQSCHPNQ